VSFGCFLADIVLERVGLRLKSEGGQNFILRNMLFFLGRKI
jgi:hypothetical protein